MPALKSNHPAAFVLRHALTLGLLALGYLAALWFAVVLLEEVRSRGLVRVADPVAGYVVMPPGPVWARALASTRGLAVLGSVVVVAAAAVAALVRWAHSTDGRKGHGAVLLALLVIPWAQGGFAHGYGPVDAHVAFWFVDDAFTDWAEGFDERTFSHVVVGQSRDSVLARLGPPLYRGRDDSLWSYTAQHRNGPHYHARRVYFDADGRVVATARWARID